VIAELAFVGRWVGTLLIAWAVWQGHTGAMVLFMVLQALGNEAAQWMFLRHERHLDDHDHAIDQLARRVLFRDGTLK
jgi:hypothetical protein